MTREIEVAMICCGLVVFPACFPCRQYSGFGLKVKQVWQDGNTQLRVLLAAAQLRRQSNESYGGARVVTNRRDATGAMMEVR
jgi:hypothetical protein